MIWFLTPIGTRWENQLRRYIANSYAVAGPIDPKTLARVNALARRVAWLSGEAPGALIQRLIKEHLDSLSDT